MKYLNNWYLFNEKLILSDGNPHIGIGPYSESDLESVFGVTIIDLEEILTDIMDEDFDIKINIKLKGHGFGRDKYNHFLIEISREDWSEFNRSIILSKLKDVIIHLRRFGLEIFFISISDNITHQINLFICNSSDINELRKDYDDHYNYNFLIKTLKEIENLNESNKTESHEDNLLKKYFDIDSHDIQDCIQDFLDKYDNMDFSISVVNQKLIAIFIYSINGDGNDYNRNITQKSHPFPKETLQILKNKLSKSGLSIETRNDNEVTYQHKYLISIYFQKN